MRRSKQFWYFIAILVIVGSLEWVLVSTQRPTEERITPPMDQRSHSRQTLRRASLDDLLEQAAMKRGEPIRDWTDTFRYPHATDETILRFRMFPPERASDEGEVGPGPDIELTNISSQPLEIRYGYWPYIYLSFRIWDERGNFIDEVAYADLGRYSPTR